MATLINQENNETPAVEQDNIETPAYQEDIETPVIDQDVMKMTTPIDQDEIETSIDEDDVIETPLIDQDDIDTQILLRENENKRLEIVQKRAASWVQAMSAVTSLLGFSFVVSGPETVSDISMKFEIAIGVLMLTGFLSLAGAIYYAYQAAYGSPTNLAEISSNDLPGLHDRMTKARLKLAKKHQSQAGWAIRLFSMGILLVVTALGVSWFVPRGEVTCLFVGNEKNKTAVAKIRGGNIELLHKDLIDLYPFNSLNETLIITSESGNC